MKTDIAISSWNALQSGQPSEFTTQDIGFHFPKQNNPEKKEKKTQTLPRLKLGKENV